MDSPLDTLHPSDLKLFDQISSALAQRGTTAQIEMKPLAGWPFAWLLHPGFVDGLTVADTTSLFRLRDCGLITISRMASARRAGDGIALSAQGRHLFQRRRQSNRTRFAGLTGDLGESRGNRGNRGRA